jgi:hypothetical protein
MLDGHFIFTIGFIGEIYHFKGLLAIGYIGKIVPPVAKWSQ